MHALTIILIAVLLFGAGYGIFLRFNMGLARNSRGQQLRRYLIAAVQAVLPAAVSGACVFSAAGIAALLVSLSWICTYNITYDLSHRASSPDYDNHMDIAFGIYLYGWLTALHLLLSLISPMAAGIATGIIGGLLLLISVAQAVYYMAYGTCIDDAGMAPLLNTYLSEAIEFVKSFGLLRALAASLGCVFILAACITANLHDSSTAALQWWQTAIIVILLIYFTVYIWKPRHGLFVRTGVVSLYIDVRQYTRSLSLYRTGMKQRLEELQVEPDVPSSGKPHTIIMVIGESACRDYMSAFSPQPFDTTPWEKRMRETDTEHFLFFPNAYSCAMQTVPSLERVLTERNQYNEKPFCDSCSIVDVARKAGYTVSWFSNQSYIGINDTSVTLVANTSDTAQWVKKTPGGMQYDTSLLPFLNGIDPARNNLVVLHLKGSHFNYSNRYPNAYARENGLHQGDDPECYRNSLHFTDSLLHSIFDKAKERLNLAAMVYFSDHGGIPEMRRSPRFLGFKMVRIPMWIYLSDAYQQAHSTTTAALKANTERYFTNDLIYELMCALIDIKSNRYDRSASIASASYKYTRDMLLTYDGRIRISDDDTLPTADGKA